MRVDIGRVAHPLVLVREREHRRKLGGRSKRKVATRGSTEH